MSINANINILLIGEQFFIKEVENMKKNYNETNTDHNKKCLMMVSGPMNLVEQMKSIGNRLFFKLYFIPIQS